MPTDREIAAKADPNFQQHFLVSAEKLSKLISAAGIRPEDEFLKWEPASVQSPESYRNQGA